MAKNPLAQLHDYGQSFWFDSLRRGLIQSGELRRMIDEDGLTGITSNPTIFNNAIAGSPDYGEPVRVLLDAGADVDGIYEGLVLDDIRMAADVLRPVYDRTQGVDGYVSLEVSPLLAHDTAGTVAQARHYFSQIGRPNVMIKVPATPEGLPAITELIGDGINVNVTLIFSLEFYRQVMEAYLAGLEQLARKGRPLNRVASVASFFVSRVDTAVDKLLEAKIAAENDPARKTRLRNLLGAAAIANSKMAYRMFREMFGTQRFQALKARGARVQRVLWASTSTKNPAYPDSRYVDLLIGPDSVNTMPPETVAAYRDHGKPAPTIEVGLDEAGAALQGLAEVGIDMAGVTDDLLQAGVDSFAQSFDKLMHCIHERREGYVSGIASRQTMKLGRYEQAVRDRLQAMDKEQFGRRLWAQDAGLFSDDPAVQAEVKKWFGWMHVMEGMREHAGDLHTFAEEIREAGFVDVVLGGMGGSSLCAEVFRQTFGPVEGYPRLTVLDTTDPETITALQERLDLPNTLFIVGTKSGTTTESLAFYHYFYDKVNALKPGRAGENFIAITDPGTKLAQEAADRGFRRTYLNPETIGGRFSALSYFGLVPAVLMGINIETLLDRAERMAQGCAACVGAEDNPGSKLGAAIAELALRGRDKLTVFACREVGSFGMWAEQLIAESTGKDGKGITPVAGEEPGDPSIYGDDRVFVNLRLESNPRGRIDETVDKLAAHGHPVIVRQMRDVMDLGAEFFLWEFATAVAGAILRINPFDQPNVEESKENTRRVLKEYERAGWLRADEVLAGDEGIELMADREPLAARLQELGVPVDGEVITYVAALLSMAQPGSYVAVMAYLPYSDEVEASLKRIRDSVRDGLRVATTLGYGPRFLHSTGQLHKGGPDTGVFIQITANPSIDMSIPGAPYGFGTLIAAQAKGDIISLQNRGRRVLRLHLKDSTPSSLGELERVFSRALELVARSGLGAPLVRNPSDTAVG